MSTPKKAAAKKSTKAAPTHPPYSVMIGEAIVALKERTGSSRQAIIKYIKANYKVGDKPINSYVNKQLAKGAAGGTYVKIKESFRLAKKEVAKKKPAAKKPAVKKPAAAKKPAKKTPKKAKKPTAKKPAAKKTSAKKAPKKAAKKPAKKATPKKKKASKK